MTLRLPMLFMGWFGPRGLASVVFTLIAFETLEAQGIIPADIVEVATWTVFLSVLSHGVTANPLARAFGRSASDDEGDLVERGRPPMPRSLGYAPPTNTRNQQMTPDKGNADRKEHRCWIETVTVAVLAITALGAA